MCCFACSAHVLTRISTEWCGYNRSRMFEALLACPGATCLAVVDSADQILGHGAVRPCVKGFKVAPLYASSNDVADALLAALMDVVMAPGIEV